MTVTIVEIVESRRISAGENPEHERRYAARGSSDDAEVKTSVEAALPALVDGMPLRSILIEPVIIDENDTIPGQWNVTAHWRLQQQAAPPQAGESSFDFDTGGASQKFTHSLGTSGIFAPEGVVAPNYGGAIGVTDSGVEGVDVTVPVYQFSETHYFAAAAVTTAYKSLLVQLTGTVNLFSFKGLNPGECLFLGAAGTRRGTDTQDPWEITFRFAGSPNAIVSIGEITGIEKRGWEYLWVRYEESEDEAAKRLVQRPIAAYVEQVYRWSDFVQLGIGE